MPNIMKISLILSNICRKYRRLFPDTVYKRCAKSVGKKKIRTTTASTFSTDLSETLMPEFTLTWDTKST